MGQAIEPALGAALAGLARTQGGLLATRGDSRATSVEGVYAGGDMTSGGTTAVQGIAEGMRAAEEIDGFLRATVS